MNEENNNVHIFELTVPGESRIHESNKIKTNKYNFFKTDCNDMFNVKVNAFEIGSHTGQIMKENKVTLKAIQKYCKCDIKFNKFVQNVSSIVVLSSYYIFNCQNNHDWNKGDTILPPFKH